MSADQGMGRKNLGSETHDKSVIDSLLTVHRGERGSDSETPTTVRSLAGVVMSTAVAVDHKREKKTIGGMVS